MVEFKLVINKQRAAGDEQRHETTIDQTPFAVDVIASQILSPLGRFWQYSLSHIVSFLSATPFVYGPLIRA